MAHIHPLRPLDPVGPSGVGRTRPVAPGPGARAFATEPTTPHISGASSPALRQIILPLTETERSFSAIDATWLADIGDALDLAGADLHQDLRDAAQDALRAAADARDIAPARLAAATDILTPDAHPSRNTMASHSHLRTSLLGRDGAGDLLTLDLHVARTAQSGWEAAVFDRAAAAANGAFPYRDPPLDVIALQLDGRLAAFVLPDPHRMLQVIVPRAAGTARGSLAAELAREPTTWLVAGFAVVALAGVVLVIRSVT